MKKSVFTLFIVLIAMLSLACAHRKGCGKSGGPEMESGDSMTDNGDGNPGEALDGHGNGITPISHHVRWIAN